MRSSSNTRRLGFIASMGAMAVGSTTSTATSTYDQQSSNQWPGETTTFVSANTGPLRYDYSRGKRADRRGKRDPSNKRGSWWDKK